MAKIRNSLGALVFQSTGGSAISFEEYERLNGINLYSLLVIQPTGKLLLNPSISKIIFLDTLQVAQDFGYEIGKNTLRLELVTEVGDTSTEEDEYTSHEVTLATAHFKIYFRHIVYTDGTTPDKFEVLSADI